MIVNARFLTQKISGVQRFSIQISREIKKQYPDAIFVAPKNIVHHDIADELDVKKIGMFNGHIWEQTDLFRFCKSKNKILLCLGNTGPIFYSNKIITLHDIAFIRFKDNFSKIFSNFYEFFIPRMLKSSKHIFTVSDFSKNEISEYYKIHKNKISVIHNAVNKDFVKSNQIINQDYVLALSNINKQKNFSSLIQAFNKLNDPKLKLYIIGSGSKNFIDQNLNIIDDSNIKIKYLGGNLTDSEIIKYYSNARLFAFTSFYEGFGIPPLEAQACGTPILLSNIPVFKEIYSDSALYCDPFSVDDIKDKIRVLIDDKILQKSLIEKGYKNIRKYSWKVSASKLLSQVKSLST